MSTAQEPAATATETMSEAAKLGTKMMRGVKLLNELRDSDVQIATTPKDEVWHLDKMTLYHYRPMAEKRVDTQVLIAYGLIGRWTMADLQDDRSLVQNLLKLGVDVYVVDWGDPSRADRFLTLDDYIGSCLRRVRRRDPRSDGARSDQPARDMRRRRVHHLLRGLASGEAPRAGSDHHADRLPWRQGWPSSGTGSSICGRAVSTRTRSTA